MEVYSSTEMGAPSASHWEHKQSERHFRLWIFALSRILKRHVIVLKTLLFRAGLTVAATVCWLALLSTASRFLFPVRPVCGRVPVSAKQHDVIRHYFGDVPLHSLVVVVRPGLYASLYVQFGPFGKYAARFSFFQSTT